MYLNVLSFKNGKTIVFRSETPYSVNKLNEETGDDRYEDWNLVSDNSTNEIISFRGTEVVTISTAPIKNDENKVTNKVKAKNKKKKSFSAKIV